MADLPPLQPILRTRRLAILLAALAALAATDASARECRGLGPADTYLMPPAKYWGLPPAVRIHAMGCERYTEFVGVFTGDGGRSMQSENADCHLSGLWVPPLSTLPEQARGLAWLALHGNGLPEAGGFMIVCTGLDATSRQMVVVHERAHAEGWEHTDAGSRPMTRRAWRTAFDAWLQARGRK